MSKPYTLFLLLIMLLFSGCGEAVPELSYSPPALPITITLNNKGELSISPTASVVTFIGTFEVGVNIPLTQNAKESGILLIIRDYNAKPPDKVFRVKVGKNITVTTNGRTVVTIDSQGVAVVDITNSRIESIEINDGDVVRIGPDGRPLCGGIPSRFTAGDTVVVDFNATGALRILKDFRGGANQTIVQAYDNHRLKLLSGPICYDNVWYWKVHFLKRDVVGWAAEGTKNDVYLCPDFQPECA